MIFKKRYCKWKFIDDLICHYSTDCGFTYFYEFTEYDNESLFKFCPYCGKRIKADNGSGKIRGSLRVGRK